MNIGLAGLSNRQLNQAITITLRLTEHANISLNTYPVVVFGHLSLQPLLPCTRSQQCFTTTTIRSFGHFEHLELPLSLCHLPDANSKLVENFEKQRVPAVVVITKKNCLRIFAASMRVISAMTGNPPLVCQITIFCSSVAMSSFR